MATTTPNFGWPVPTSTDLVKDGAVAIEALGDAVDASLLDLKGGTTGQVLAKATNTDMDFAWIAADDTNAIQNAIVDAKGDLIAASAADTPARLAVGANGETLVADSSTATGLRYQGNFAAGKNKIINGDFGVWQRGTSFTTAGGNFCSDRMSYNAGTTPTVSRSTFTPGTAPVAGYEGQYFLTFVKGNTTADAMSVTQRIEDVRTFAGQTVTLSFWAKASAAVTNEPLTRQVFGSGGSGDVYTTYTTQSITTSWARYSMTFTMPSVSGKTIGASSYVDMYFWRFTGTTNITVDLWGVQLEAGSVATAFQTATGTIQGELAACQRYYYRQGGDAAYQTVALGWATSTISIDCFVNFPVQLRAVPSSTIEWGNLQLSDLNANYVPSSISYVFDSSKNVGVVRAAVTGATAFRNYSMRGNNSLSNYLAFSAEL